MDAKTALQMFEVTKSYWADIYRAFREDVRFSIGLDHWDDDSIRKRGELGCMVVPILPQYIHQVMNDMRQNEASINVIPAHDGADEETAKICKGLIRSIEYRSGADEVYDTASEYAVRGGFGFVLVDHDYISEDSFLQELKLKRVQNPEAVYLDPTSTSCDGSDAEYGFVLDSITKKDFEEKYPGKAFISFDSLVNDPVVESITICQMFVKEYKTIDKQMAADGKMVDNIPDADEEKEKSKRKRKLRKVTIKRYLMSGEDILEETTFPGKYVPIVLFMGEEVWVENKRYLMSLIRQAKDAQRRVNKWASKESELLDMAPIAPVMAAVGSVEDFMDEWGNPGDVNVMRYKTMDAAGNQLPIPQRLNPPTPPTGFINAMEGAKEAVKEALGMYNASVGQRSNAISGVAYNAQKLESDVATYHFPDNRNRSIQQCGRILISAFPEVYDTGRIVQIVGDEQDTKMVGINGMMRPDQKQTYDLTKAEYDVRVTTGASYTTKRQESAALFGDILKAQPDMIKVIGDLWAKNLDSAGADAMAERLKKLVPPELQDSDQQEDPKVQQMTQIIQQLQAQLQQAGQALQSKQSDEAIKQEEVQIKKTEAAIKQEEVNIKKGELKLKIYEATRDPSAVQPESNEDTLDAGIQHNIQSPIDQNNMQMMALSAQQAHGEQQTALLEQEIQLKQEDMQLKQVEIQQREEQGQAIIGTLGAIADRLNLLTAQAGKPINVIRDENGVIIGAN